ncbi:MAG: urease accessory protein UreF [Pseudolabrys sp.]
MTRELPFRLPEAGTETEHVDFAALYRVMAWLSPAYPIGAFSYSSGIEWAVETGDIRDAASLGDWIDIVLTGGGGFCDAVFFAHAHRAVAAGDTVVLRHVSELALAFAPTKERYLETTAQGRAFVDVTRSAWPSPPLNDLEGVIALPIAVAAACAAHRVPVAPGLLAYLQAMVANLVSAGVRLVPLGQTDGQRVTARLEAVVQDTAKRALGASLDDAGGAAFRADIASMRHETQYTRLFRS